MSGAAMKAHLVRAAKKEWRFGLGPRGSQPTVWRAACCTRLKHLAIETGQEIESRKERNRANCMDG